MGDLYDPFADEFGDDEEDEDYDDYVAFENPTVETFVVNDDGDDDESEDEPGDEPEDEQDVESDGSEPDDESGDFLCSEPPKRTSMAEIRAKMAARQAVEQDEPEPEPEPRRRKAPERDFTRPGQNGTGNSIKDRTGASRGPRTADKALERETMQELPESVYEEPDFNDEPMELPPPRRVKVEAPELDECESEELVESSGEPSVEPSGEPEYDEVGLGGFANALVRLFSGKKKRK